MSRWPVALLCVGLLGTRAAAQTPQTIIVESPTLKADQPMPRDYTADGRNVSPPLTWSNVPAGAKQLAVVCEDPDAGNPPPFVHWVIYKIPPTAKGLPEKDPVRAGRADAGGDRRRDPGRVRLPAPDLSRARRRRRARCITIISSSTRSTRTSDLKPGLNRADLLAAINGHVIGQGELVATYERKHTMTFISRRDLLKRAAVVGAAPRRANLSGSRTIARLKAPRSPNRCRAPSGSRPRARAAREPDGGRGGPARRDRRAADSDRRQRPRRDRSARRALHRSRARRRARLVAPGVHRRPRGARSLRALVARQGVHRAVADRSGFGADRRRDRRRDRLHRQLRGVLRAGAESHAPGHLRRSVLRRQRELRRLGSDRLSGRPHDGDARRISSSSRSTR